VRGRIGRHLLEPGPGAALARASSLGGFAGALEALDQVVADALELGHVGDVALGPKQGMGGLTRLARVRRIGRELSLQARDLAAKLLTAEPLVALHRRHVGLGRRREGRRIDRELLGPGGVDRTCQVAWIDAALPGAVHGVGGQPLEVRGAGCVLGHERAQAVAGRDQPVLHQAAVDRARGVDVHPGAARELADARKPVPGAELAARDQDPEPPRELSAKRQIVGPGEIGCLAERDIRCRFGGVCH
jgi:hypothetical protein